MTVPDAFHDPFRYDVEEDLPHEAAMMVLGRIPRGAAFDGVVFKDVLEHVADPAALLRDARSLLRPGGRVIASIPNVAHWTVRLRLLFGHFDYTPTGLLDATHLRFFMEASVRALFRTWDASSL